MTMQAQRATLRVNAQNRHQQITGFGGFVCSPQFQYNHMSTNDIKKVWGPSSPVGCNIMRLYIPIGRSSWSLSLQTAKNAKQMGLIVFASPWGQPAEWKTNGTVNAKDPDGTLGYLKKENWPDYAQYLEDYVQYLRDNGVELDAISIQNEPDWTATYAGCLWSASEIAEFVKTYGKSISCKVMAPETLSVNDNYVNALNKTDILECFDIYGGHQYGGIQSAYKNLAKKGKEIWMTEYLINWNENQSTNRNFDFSKDFFNFFTAINTCMLGDFNAWIHYAAKRYYGMLGDGQYGTTSGTVTKRGYVMGHFARFVTGMTRIDAIASGTNMESSAYLSQTGDTVVVVLSNSNEKNCELTVDLPFYTTYCKSYTTNKSKNLSSAVISPQTETCRPVASIPAQSVVTLLYTRSRDRQPSDMAAKTTRFDRLDDMTTTKSNFGTTYKLSGKTKAFDHSNPLISSRTSTSYGYVALNDRYTQLVMHVDKVTSTMNYTASKTTLLYINNAGQLNRYDYGTIDFSRRENFDLVFDLSSATLTDGCRGLISLTNDNWSSTLTITFGDVYLGTNYAATLSGDYVADDSYVLEYSSDPTCTSIDMTAVTGLPATLPWLEGTNRVAIVGEESAVTGDNIVKGGTCNSLVLNETAGDFRPAQSFMANDISLTVSGAEGLRFVCLPFNTEVPEGVHAYTLDEEMHLQAVTSIMAHQPVLITAEAPVTFRGSGSVAYAPSPLDDVVRGTYSTTTLQVGDYIVAQQEGQWGLQALTAPTVLLPFGAYACPSSTDSFIPFDASPSGIANVTAAPVHADAYNLFGQKVGRGHRGIVIVHGKKMIRR